MDHSVVDVIETVSDEEAFATLAPLSQNLGLLAGPSSGAVAAAALRYLDRLKKEDVVVMIFGDSGRAYLTKKLHGQKAT
jgi:cysteine synthase